MKLQLGANTYFVRWHHGVEADKRARKITECRIYMCGEDKVEIEVAYGKATTHQLDAFVKNTGRKISLTVALEDSKFSKEERGLIWNTYFSLRHGKH